MENANIEKFKCDILSNFQTLCALKDDLLLTFLGLFFLLGDPKGIQHPTGGHAVVNRWTMKALYGME